MRPRTRDLVAAAVLTLALAAGVVAIVAKALEAAG
jgi:hypothetical protein